MSIFNPNDRKSTSGQNPPSGGSNDGIGRQVINAIFGRNPLFFNAGLGDTIAPIVDTTLFYPLSITTAVQQQSFVGVGATVTFKWTPPVNKHWMVNFLNVLNPHRNMIGGSYGLFLVIPNLQDITIAGGTIMQGLDSVPIPLIGGQLVGLDATVPASPFMIRYDGIKSVYLNENMTLQIGISGGNNQDITNTQIAYMELPSNQPFGPGLTL